MKSDVNKMLYRARFFYTEICDNIDDSGVILHSINKLSEITGIARSTITRYLNVLRANKWIYYRSFGSGIIPLKDLDSRFDSSMVKKIRANIKEEISSINNLVLISKGDSNG